MREHIETAGGHVHAHVPADPLAGLGEAYVVHGDARKIPLPDACVDLVVTSPPYYALRNYEDDDGVYEGQIGAEPTLDEYVTSLIEVTAQCMRVLKPSGSLFINLGDKYSDRAGPAFDGSSDGHTKRYGKAERINTSAVAPRKSLLGIPWRYALRCIDELGLILREEVIWAKPNGLPESVTDRCRRSHEQWFHFTLRPRYYAAVDEIRESYAPDTFRRYQTGFRFDDSRPNAELSKHTNYRDGDQYDANPLGKLPGSVWTIPTEPLNLPDHLGIDHFAAFPTEWPRRIIAGWSPAEVCTVCGQGRFPVTQVTRTFDGEPVGRGEGSVWGSDGKNVTRNRGVGNWRFGSDAAVAGYACGCTPRTSHRGARGDWREGREASIGQRAGESVTQGPLVARKTDLTPTEQREWEYHFDGWTPPPTDPAVVLDPFGGTGTTAMVARALGRVGITLDLSRAYCRAARWRITESDGHYKARGIPKPKDKPGVDQLGFDLGGEAS